VPGAVNTLNLYLSEYQPAGATFSVAGDGGLLGAGVALVETSGSSGVTITAMANNTQPEPNGFTGEFSNGTFANGTGGYVYDLVSAASMSGIAPASVTHNADGSTNSLYLLGSATLAVGANPSVAFKVE